MGLKTAHVAVTGNGRTLYRSVVSSYIIPKVYIQYKISEIAEAQMSHTLQSTILTISILFPFYYSILWTSILFFSCTMGLLFY